MSVVSTTIAPSRQEQRTPVLRAGFDAWWMLTITFLLNLVAYLDRTIVSMIVPDIKSTLHVSDFQMGLVLGPAFAVFYAIVGVPLGWASDRYSRRQVIFWGVAMFGIATVLSGFAQSFGALLTARMVVAIGEAALLPAAMSLISEKFPRNLMNTAVSIYSTGLKVGGAAAFGLGAVAIVYAGIAIHGLAPLQGVEPWRLVFVFTGAPAIVLALLVFTFREPPRSARAAVGGAVGLTATQYLLAERRLYIPMLIGFSLMVVCGQILISWTPTLITRQFGWGPARYGPVLALIALASSATLVMKGAAMDWLYTKGIKDIHIRFYVWLIVASLPMVAGVFLVHDVWLFMVLYAVVAIVTIPSVSYANVAVQMIAPPHLRGRMAAIVSVPMMLVGGLGPMLVGGLTDYLFDDEARLGASMAIVFCTLIPAALFCFMLCLKPLRRAVVMAESRDAADDPPPSAEPAMIRPSRAPARPAIRPA